MGRRIREQDNREGLNKAKNGQMRGKRVGEQEFTYNRESLSKYDNIMYFGVLHQCLATVYLNTNPYK